MAMPTNIIFAYGRPVQYSYSLATIYIRAYKPSPIPSIIAGRFRKI